MKDRKRLLAVAVVALLGAGACSNERVDDSHVGIHYTQGPIEGDRFDHVIQPGGSQMVVDDIVYRLPARQITYITESPRDGDGNVAVDQVAEGADGPSLFVTAKGGERMVIDLAVRSFLNSRDETIKTFFNDICKKTRSSGDTEVDGCWDGASDQGQLGWDLMLRETFGNPAEAVAQDTALDFEAEELRYNNETKDEFAEAFAAEFRRAQQRLIGNGEYFCGPGYDRDAEEDDDSFCPPLAVEVTRIRFVDNERETLNERETTAREERAAIAEEILTARDEQELNAARSTPEAIALIQANAMRDCAANAPECRLTIIVGSNDEIAAAVNANP